MYVDRNMSVEDWACSVDIELLLTIRGRKRKLREGERSTMVGPRKGWAWLVGWNPEQVSSTLQHFVSGPTCIECGCSITRGLPLMKNILSERCKVSVGDEISQVCSEYAREMQCRILYWCLCICVFGEMHLRQTHHQGQVNVWETFKRKILVSFPFGDCWRSHLLPTGKYVLFFLFLKAFLFFFLFIFH